MGLMKNGIIYNSDGEKLIEIFHAFDIDGNQKRSLTMEELVLLFAIGKKILNEIGI